MTKITVRYDRINFDGQPGFVVRTYELEGDARFWRLPIDPDDVPMSVEVEDTR